MNSNTILEAKETKEALKLIKAERLANKDAWIYLDVRVPGQFPLLVKSFNLSIQVLRKNGIRYPDGFDLSAKQFDELITYALER